MDTQEMLKKIEEINATLKDKVLPLVPQVGELRDAHGELIAKFKAAEAWLAEVDKKASKERFGLDGQDHLLEAIPERYKPMLELYRRRGAKDAPKKVATECWIKNVMRCLHPKYMHDTPMYREENDKLALALGDDVTKAADSPFAEAVGATGGFVVPTPLEAEVFRLIEDAAVMRQMCRIITMTAFQHEIPTQASGVVVAFKGEGATGAEQEPTLGQGILEAKTIFVWGRASLESIQDASIGLLAYWMELATEAYGLFEDDQILEGDGIGNNFTGISDDTNVNVVTNLPDGSAPTYAKLVEQVYKAVKRATRRAEAAFVMAPATLQAIIGLEETGGAPLLNRQDVARVLSQNIVGPGVGEGTILGYATFTSDQIRVDRTVGGSTNSANIYFGPYKQGIILGDLLGITFDTSEHVHWKEGQLAVRMMKRTAVLIPVGAALTRQEGVDATL